MRVVLSALCFLAASFAVAQETDRPVPVPEFSKDLPAGVPDASSWPTTGEFQAGATLTEGSQYTPGFLNVLKPEGVCASESTHPCVVIMRFAFWNKGDTSGSLHVGRFIVGNPGHFVEAIATTDRVTFSYWVKRKGVWTPLEQNSELYRAHHEFYQFLQLLQLASRSPSPPKPVPRPKQKVSKPVIAECQTPTNGRGSLCKKAPRRAGALS